MNKYLFIGLLLLLVGCSSPEKEDKVSAIESNSSPTPSLSSANVNNATPSLNPEAFPDLSNKEKLGEVNAENDLIDLFYFDGNGVKVSSREVAQVPESDAKQAEIAATQTFSKKEAL